MGEREQSFDTGSPLWQHGWRRGERVAVALCEAGYGTRPWALWLGPPGLHPLLSPYTHDLAPQLAGLAPEHDTHALVGTPAPQSSVLVRRAQLCGVASALLTAEPALARERERVERSVGITQLPASGAVVIDLARIDWAAAIGCSAQPPHDAVLVQLAPHPSDAEADVASLCALGTLLGPTLYALARVVSCDTVPAGRAQRRLDAVSADASESAWLGAVAQLGRSSPALDFQSTVLEVACEAPLLGWLRAAAMWLSSAKR